MPWPASGQLYSKRNDRGFRAPSGERPFQNPSICQVAIIDRNDDQSRDPITATISTFGNNRVGDGPHVRDGTWRGHRLKRPRVAGGAADLGLHVVQQFRWVMPTAASVGAKSISDSRSRSRW